MHELPPPPRSTPRAPNPLLHQLLDPYFQNPQFLSLFPSTLTTAPPPPPSLDVSLQHQTRTPKHALQHAAACCNTLQHAATYCITRQHTTTHGNTRQHTALFSIEACTAKSCHIPHVHHTATHCKHTITHGNTTQQHATH